MGTPDKKKKKTSKQINKEFTRSLSLLQESLASLRVVVKYMQYDLEATKRENKVLKDRLEATKRENKVLKDRLAKYEGESQSGD